MAWPVDPKEIYEHDLKAHREREQAGQTTYNGKPPPPEEK